MIKISGLQTSLLDILHEIEDTGIKFIIGGGFGIYLKTEHVRRLGMRTLLRVWPEPRSTNDLDLFLRPELLINAMKLKPPAEAIARLGYQAVPGAEKYQFIKPRAEGNDEGGIKIDSLTGPQNWFQDTRVKVDARRARPSPSVLIHAHPLNEAPTLEMGLLFETLVGNLSSDEPYQAEVFLPHPYTFAMMKLFAFSDRLDDVDKEFGRYHALDLYAIMSTTTEEEWRYALKLSGQLGDQPYVLEAGRLVFEHFSSLDRVGMVRLRESPYYRNDFQLDEFMSALQELFPTM